MRYDEAQGELRRACEVITSTTDERREAFDLLARTLAALGRLSDAEIIYAELLTADVEAPAPRRASPKIRELYRRAKQRVYPDGFVSLTQLPAVRGRVALKLVDPWDAVEDLLLYSAGPGEDFSERPINKKEASNVSLAEPSPGTSRRWYVVARAREGRVAAQLGSHDEPRVLEAVAVPSPALLPQEPPLATRSTGPLETSAVSVAPAVGPPRWPAWIAAGLSVAAAGAGAALWASSEQDYRDAGAAEYGADTRRLDARHSQKLIYADVLFGGALVSGLAAAYLVWR